MNRVSERPSGAKPTDPPLPLLDLGNPAEVSAWLIRLETVAEDGFAAGEDQLLPLDKRRLGRVVARAIVAEARTALAELLGAARRALASARSGASDDPR